MELISLAGCAAMRADATGGFLHAELGQSLLPAPTLPTLL